MWLSAVGMRAFDFVGFEDAYLTYSDRPHPRTTPIKLVRLLHATRDPAPGILIISVWTILLGARNVLTSGRSSRRTV